MSHAGESRRVLVRYFADVRPQPRLSRERERELSGRVRRGCTESRNELVGCNLGFVAKVALEYKGLGVPLEDLLNEGTLGLMEAAQRFDPSRGNRFLTYATWWIRKSILRALAHNSNIVRLPDGLAIRARELSRAEEQLRQELGRRPRTAEISARLDTSEARIAELRRLRQRPTSLDGSLDEEATPLSERLIDEQAADILREIIEDETVSVVEEVVSQLAPTDQAVVNLRFGLGGESPMTLREVGEILHVSRERVRQIELRAKQTLQRLFRRRYAAPRPAIVRSRLTP